MQSLDEQIADLLQGFQHAQSAIEDGVDQALVDSGNFLKTEIQESFRSRQSPSVSGLPPRNQTGRLRMSISTRLDKYRYYRTVKVGTNVDYAVKLEKGIGCWPHPFMFPALLKNGIKIRAKIERALRETLK